MDDLKNNPSIKEEDLTIDPARTIAFSDAVFAFAITLLVLKIDIPNLTENEAQARLLQELIKLWPQYLANILGFLVIGYYWLLHHKVFLLIKRYDTMLIWINIFLLMFISFLPFPTDLLGTYSREQVTAIFYALSLSSVGIMQTILWLYASHNHRLIDKNLSSQVINYYTLRSSFPPIVFLASIPLSFISVAAAEISWFVVLLIALFYHRKIEYYKK